MPADTLMALLAAIDSDAGVTIPDTWLQGRTAYGGLSAAIALTAALQAYPDLPPLRSAQIAFIGPLGGTVRPHVTQLRRGRTAAFVQCDLFAGDALGLRALFIFMHAQDSHVDRPAPVRADLPAKGAPFTPPPSVKFAHYFELLDGRGDALEDACVTRWARLREREGLHPAVEMLAIGDVLPPAAMTLFKKPGPISTMSWQVNFLSDPPRSMDGWWLVETRADHAQHGSSSQQMQVWNSAGLLNATALQSVALFV